MKFLEFKIKNFKGIEDITFKLDTSPNANIYTLVGLNESGKTTILEAINYFTATDKNLNSLELPGSVVKNYNDLIPISKRDNFNDRIEIIVKTLLEETDKAIIQDFVKINTPFKKVLITDGIINYFNYYNFKNSDFTKFEQFWTGFSGTLKTSQRDNFKSIGQNFQPEVNFSLFSLCKTLIPNILYFPNFLFDFPSRIYLETKEPANPKEKFYIDLIQDILNSLENGTDVKTHLIDRMHAEASQKRNLDRLIQKMEIKVTEVVFDAWNLIFKRNITNTRVVINYDIDGNNLAFLDFEIEAEDGIYQINERSLGFKWFFTFLLFTQFRPFRLDGPQNSILLFDEPASNLHSSAQKQLLKSFENLTANSKVIYTTHSHHLINPNWLESTYVVKNEGLNLDNPETYNSKKTNITIEPYREFASKHPHNTAYFQPILDVLDYVPSDLESISNCVFLEGKNDYYTLAYFKNVVLKTSSDLNMAPSTGSGNLDTLITLYIGWGKKFVILLDSDKAGKTEKQRYIEKFGPIIEKRIYLLSDIDPNWDKKSAEALFNVDDRLNFQLRSYPDAKVFNKTHFNRAIQESLINNSSFEFSEETKINFSEILNFLKKKMPES